MSIQYPTKPWAIVLCSIEGSNPPQSQADTFRAQFGYTGDHQTIADFWTDVTQGLVDVSRSDVFGWYDSGYTMIGTPGLTPYPGVTNGKLRVEHIDHAREILHANRPELNLDQYRSVLAVYNFSLNAGNAGGGVLYGLDPGSDLGWAQSGWGHCVTCSGLIRVSKVGLPCASGVGRVAATHTLDSNNHDLQIPTHSGLLQSVSGFSACQKCGALYEMARSNGCPGFDGVHGSDGSQFYLPANWAGAIGDYNWQRCQDCGLVLQPNSQFLCPRTLRAHNVLGDQFCFPRRQIGALSLQFMCHEMGHAFGFVHGRNSQPDSTSLDNDACPGAYGDRFDIMSAGNCDSYPDAAGQPAGPAIASHQLLRTLPSAIYGIPFTPPPWVHVCDPTQINSVLIRPADSPGVAAPILIRIDDFVAELRMHNGPDGRQTWDRALNFGGASAAVLVHSLVPYAPTLLTSTKGQPYLLGGDQFRGREGLGNVAIDVSYIDERTRTARLTVWKPSALPRIWQRWLIIPCTYDGDPTNALDQAKLRDLISGGVEGYWQDMSGGASNVRGSYVLSAISSTGWRCFSVASSAAAAQNQDALSRVTSAIQAVRETRSPLDPTIPLFLDWRWFTGIIVVSDLPVSDGYLGRIDLPSGNLPPSAVAPGGSLNCAAEIQIGDCIGPLSFDVIEAGRDRTTSVGLNVAIGSSLGLDIADIDPYHLMTSDGAAFRSHSMTWDPSGPSISADQMNARGWLLDRDFEPQAPFGARHTSGSVHLVPLTRRTSEDGWLRLNLGPLSFECRSRESWDAGLPDAAIVLACMSDASEAPRAMHVGDTIGWVGSSASEVGPGLSVPSSLIALLGGGSVKVVTLDATGATLDYSVSAGQLLVGNPLPWYERLRIPHGDPDPWEQKYKKFVDQVIEPEVAKFFAELGAALSKLGGPQRR